MFTFTEIRQKYMPQILLIFLPLSTVNSVKTRPTEFLTMHADLIAVTKSKVIFMNEVSAPYVT